MYTLNELRPWTSKNDHEGYTAGYFIEAAIAHYLATGKKSDDPMIRAARRLADCWMKTSARAEEGMVRRTRGTGAGARPFVELR